MHFEGHEEHWMLNFSEHAYWQTFLCHLPSIHTRLLPCFWGRITCLTSPDLICPHEMSCWFIALQGIQCLQLLFPFQNYPTTPLTLTETSVFSYFVLQLLFSMCLTLSKCN
jgi:hypothetical protein